jgi:four helix bundle protein
VDDDDELRTKNEERQQRTGNQERNGQQCTQKLIAPRASQHAKTSYPQTSRTVKSRQLGGLSLGMSFVAGGGMADLKRMRDRTYELQCAVIHESRRKDPEDDAERVLWHELLRAQTSLATNSAESDGTQSRQDFIQKFQISLKEARESFQLLRLLKHSAPERANQLTALLQQCDEIIAILVTSLRTAKARQEAEQRKREAERRKRRR